MSYNYNAIIKNLIKLSDISYIHINEENVESSVASVLVDVVGSQWQTRTPRTNRRCHCRSLPRADDWTGIISAPGSCPRARAAGKQGWRDQVNGPHVRLEKGATVETVHADVWVYIWRGRNKPVGKLGRCLCSMSFFTSSFTHLGDSAQTRRTSATCDMRPSSIFTRPGPRLC